MDLLEYNRVIYQKNPLNEVICQLRFPPLLKITEQKPVDFQEGIRHQYPFFEISQGELPADISKVAQKLGFPLNSDNSYIFKSEDEKWQISLTKEFIAITTSDYQRYEDFKMRFQEVIELFETLYKPSFYTKIGLRYQDLIVRSKLNLEDKEWHELISQNIADELHHPQLSKSLKFMVKNLVFENNKGLTTLKHGLVNVQNSETKTEELCYLIDMDFQTQEKVNKNDDIWNTINYFNKLSRNLFRFSITDILHQAMSPTEISG